MQKNNNEFDDKVTKDNHEKTLDALNMLIEESEQRKLLKETKKKRKDESLDDSGYDPILHVCPCEQEGFDPDLHQCYCGKYP